MTTDTNKKIFEYVKENGKVRPAELVRKFGFTQAAIHRQLNKLQNKKLIEKKGTPPSVFYQIPQKSLEEQVSAAFKKDGNIVSAYFLGSYNSGTFNSESDFDLAVVVEKKVSEKKIYQLIRHLRFPKSLDLSVVTKSSSPIFLFQIVSTGKRVYEININKAIAFEDYSLHNYYDTQHLRDINHRYLRQKFYYASQ